jgi:hypothetical protein
MDKIVVKQRLDIALEKRLKKPFSVDELELLTGGSVSCSGTWSAGP